MEINETMTTQPNTGIFINGTNYSIGHQHDGYVHRCKHCNQEFSSLTSDELHDIILWNDRHQPCSSMPLVVLLSGLPGTGKSTFAPHLADEMGAVVLDTDDIFSTAREYVGAILGVGHQVVHEEGWKKDVHGRLLSLLLSLASTAAQPGRPVIAVSPWTGFLKDYPASFNAASAGLNAQFRWVIARCEPEIRLARIKKRGRQMDVVDVNQEKLPTPPRAVSVDLSYLVDAYPIIAKGVANQLRSPEHQTQPAR